MDERTEGDHVEGDKVEQAPEQPEEQSPEQPQEQQQEESGSESE